MNVKRISFPGTEIQKLSVVSIQLFSAWFRYFFLVAFKKPYLMSVPKIVEVTHAIITATFQEKIVRGTFWKKRQQRARVQIERKFCLGMDPIPLLMVITWLDLASMEPQCLVSGQLPKTMRLRWALDRSPRFHRLILVSRDLVLIAVN